MKLQKYLTIFFILIINISVIEIVSADSRVSQDFLMGKFNPKNHPGFVRVNRKFASRNGMYLQKEAYTAFKRMYQAALKDGVRLRIISATRNYKHQKRIWEAKWTGRTKVSGKNLAKTISAPVNRAKKILRYSSMPGSSRHHWGTEVDLNSFNNNWFRYGKGARLYQWLQQNAKKYGYCQVYTKKNKARLNGYEEEKWHWSYMPLSSAYTRLSDKHLRPEYFSGFKGSAVATKIDIINSYVLSINPACK